MSKKQVEDALNEFKEVPETCRKQIELQRDNYINLINKMDEYDWSALFSTGVEIKEKEGDPQVFLSRLLIPVKLYLFTPDPEDESGVKVKVMTRSLPSLLEEKLRAIGFYLGPLGQKIYTSNKEEVTNPFKVFIDKKTRIARVICA